MKKQISSLFVKTMAVLLSFIILFECNAYAFSGFGANLSGQNFSFDGAFLEENLSDTAALDERLSQLYMQGEEENSYEAALEREVQAEILKVKKSKDIAKLRELIKNGKSKYGILSPSYVRVSGSKQLNIVESDLLSFIASYLYTPVVMPLKDFEKFYKEAVKQAADEYAALNPVEDTVPYRSSEELIVAEIKNSYPLKAAYDSYKQEAAKEIAWRNNNKVKIEEAMYKVVRQYLSAVAPENLSSQTLHLLLNVKFAGKELISTAERKNIYDYAVTRLEKQKLNLLKLGVFSGKKDTKVAAGLLKDIIETIIVGSFVAKNDGGRYAKAVENIVYRSYEGIGFSHILTGGFSALLGVKEYSALRRILTKYNKEELEGADFGDYFDLTFYSHKVENIKGKFLGKVSKNTQYATDYIYGNVFGDIAELLAEDGSAESLKILKEFSTDKGFKKSIKPFYAAALISGKSGAQSAEAAKAALALTNISFGDIEAIQEYDLDRALIAAYPGIKDSLGNGAISNKSRMESKQAQLKRFDYFHRAAEAGNIFLLIWGTVGLVKLGGKAISLTTSTYTAVKAGRIATGAKRLAYIKANYAKMGKYISARNSLARMKWRIKSGGFKVKSLVGAAKGASKPQQPAKLTNYFNHKELNALYDIRKQAVMDVRNTAKPTARQQAKAQLATAQYKAKAAQIDYLSKARGTASTTIEAKQAAYIQKVKTYNSNASLYNSKLQALAKAEAAGADAKTLSALRSEVETLGALLKVSPTAPVYTPLELNYLNSYNTYASSLTKLNTARSNFQATSWWNRNIAAPWTKFWTPAGNGTLGIAELETGKGITIAEALGIDKPYNPNYTKGVRFFSSTYKPGKADKFYTFLRNHKLGPVADGLKFVNNKATLFSTTLLFNYNVATVTPAMLESSQAARTATEIVVNGGRLAAESKPLTLFGNVGLPLNSVANMPKPVNVIDPKMFAHFNGVPLPGGNIVNNFSLKGLFGTVGNVTAMTGAGLAMPILFGKDLYTAFDKALLKKPSLNIAPARSLNIQANLQTPAVLGGKQVISFAQDANTYKPWDVFDVTDYSPIPFPFQADKYVYEVPGIPHLSSGLYSHSSVKQTENIPVLDPAYLSASYDNLVNQSIDMEGRTMTMSIIGANGVEKMLPVALSINENFDAKEYTNVVFNKGVAELREAGKTPRVMSNFYIRLKNENKSLFKLVEALQASGKNITLKVWHLGLEPDKMATVPLYSPDGALKLPVKIITDARFVDNGNKLVLMPSGRIGVLGPNAFSPDVLPTSVIIRVPKNQLQVLLGILQDIKAPVPLEIMPSYNKADVITKQGFYINPSLGKTLGPVLPESLGVSEAFATNLMYFVNYLPGLLSPLLNPLIKKYGEVVMFKVSIAVSILAALLPSLFGFYGYASTMDPTVGRSISLGFALFALAFSINIRNVVGNSLINMNRGSMPISKDKKKEEKTIAEATKITLDILFAKFKKLFQNGTDFSMEDILYYNRSFINKNLGTMAFLIAPSVLNYGGRMLGYDFGFGWDVSLPLYAAYSAYAGYKVHTTNLRDKKIIDHIKSDIYKETPLAAENPNAKDAIGAAAATEKKDIFKDVKEIFDIMLHKEGVMSIVVGMSLATAHELSVSSAFSSTLYQIIPDGDMATFMVIGVLYGSLMLGRLLGNITTTRMSAGTSYLGYSALSLAGTAAILGGIMADSHAAIISGGVIASIGMGNYFSQMFAYIIRKHPELQSQISQALSFTMPIAVLLSLPVTYLNDWTGLPYMRVMASLGLLVASMISTKGMLESSTLYKYIVQEFKEASDYVVGLYKKGNSNKSGGDTNQPTDTPPTDMNNPLPN